ncbi:MAG: hypothetical protein ACXVCP_08035 [Bdellovibrio sp.]
MKTRFFFVAIAFFVIFKTQAFANPASVVINQDVLVNKQGYNSYTFSAVLGKPKCKLEVTSVQPILLKKNTILEGEISVLEKYVWQDADNVDKSATTRIVFKSNDNAISISSACFTHGFIFPTAGLPTAKKLLQMSQPYYFVR